MTSKLAQSPKLSIGTLPIMESFYTIQGEGFHTGKPAWFIRLGGCDVGCHWCDVKESWNVSNHPTTSINEIFASSPAGNCKIAVVTGGEPAMYNLAPLTTELRDRDMQAHIETSGAYPLTGKWHWICFSPKKFKEPVEGMHQLADELKIVVFHKHDLQWAKDHAKLVRKDCMLYLQPEWSKREEMLPEIIEFVKSNPGWRISLQTHKYINVP